MHQLITDVSKASQRSKRDASREIWITVVVALSAFFVGPLLFAMLIIPGHGAMDGLLSAFIGADVYIAAVSLLSISVVSISKEYNIQGKDYFAFPHAASILISAFLITIIGFVVYSARAIYQAAPEVFKWRAAVAGCIGWITFVVASLFAYAVLVLRNEMEVGAAHTPHTEEVDFVEIFNKARAEGNQA